MTAALGRDACSPAAAPTAAEAATAAGEGHVSIKVAPRARQRQGAVDAFNAQVKQFEQANPRIDGQVQEYKWTADEVHRAARRRHAAGRRSPCRSPTARPDRATSQIADISGDVGAALRQEVQPRGHRRRARTRRQDGSASRSRRTRRRCTTTARCSSRPGSTRTSRRPPGTRSAPTRSRSRERTGEAGYAQMTKDNTGGWILDHAGLRVRRPDREARRRQGHRDHRQPADRGRRCRTLHAMRWDDNSMGANFLYDWSGINQDSPPAGSACTSAAGDVYDHLVSRTRSSPPTTA